MVDEFQDTNWAQYELLKLLAGQKKNLTVVGDDDQAIYKFRGASLANILQFRDDFPQATTVALTENYRSRKEILDLAYSFIKKNDPNRLEVRLKDTGLSKQLRAMRGEGGDVEVLWNKRIEDEVEGVVEKIKLLKHQDPETVWNDFAILVRSNDGAEPFVYALERHGVPFQFLALRGLYAKPVILDVISLLSLCDGYHESAAVWRTLTLPCYLMPAKDMAELLQYANRKGISLWTAVGEAGNRLPATCVSEEGMKIAHALATHVHGLAEAARRETPMKVFQMALDKTGYLAALVRQPEEGRRESLQHLNAFADRLKRFEHSTHGPTLRGFLEEFKAELESGEEGALDHDPDAGPDMVKVLTVHAAKGLEFKHVFVVSLVDQRFPTRARAESIPLPDGLVQERLPEGDLHLEEERRLFYVALTRAKDTLTLTGAQSYGGTRAKKPSSFFSESSLEIHEAPEEGDGTKQLVPIEPLIAGPHGQPLAYYELKRRFSFTQLAAFRKCPLQYKFAHIYRIPILGSFQKSFGQSLHLAFQRMLELHVARGSTVQGSLFDVPTPHAKRSIPSSGFRVTEDEALNIFEDAWIDEWYQHRAQHDDYKSRGRSAVRNFWKACCEQVPNVLEVEKDFTLLLGKHSIKGKIDRIDQLPDGSVSVLDYKTGEAKETLDAEDKEQLYLYQIALEERGLKVGRLAYLYVKDWILKEVEPLEGKGREKFLEKVTARMDEILISDYSPTPEPFTCRFCDFRHICEFKKV
jgi:DNA helicase II / ATP-dependent DNA helicase PcrA